MKWAGHSCLCWLQDWVQKELEDMLGLHGCLHNCRIRSQTGRRRAAP